MGADTKSSGISGSGGTVPTEDFLYHLHKGSDLLMQDKVVEAKEELERALTFQPQDAKSQDLLAGVYFRLGVYPRAIEIWGTLVAAYPDDPTLRVNLGLALFKTGQNDDALDHIHRALRMQPDHERAWGYLGLIHWRRGQLEEAREAFLRGGQATMARRMEESLDSSSGRVQAAPVEMVGDGAPQPSAAPASVTEAPEDAAAEERERSLRSAADEAIARMEQEDLRLAVAEAAKDHEPHGAWQTRAPGEEPVPLVHRRVRPLPAGAPPSLGSLLAGWTVEQDAGTPLAVGPAGHLHVRTESSVLCRTEGLEAVRGQFRTAIVHRRARGKDIDEVLGGDNPLMRWHGPIEGMLAPPEGRRFHALSLEEGDMLHLRESLLFAFDDRVDHQTGRLPLAGEPAVLIQLQGPGSVVLCMEGQPRGLRVVEGQEVRVDPHRVVGWSGRLLPGATRGTLPYAATAPPLSFRGEGTVLLA